MSLSPEQHDTLNNLDRSKLRRLLEERLADRKAAPSADPSDRPEDPPTGSPVPAPVSPDGSPKNLTTFGPGSGRGRPRKGKPRPPGDKNHFVRGVDEPINPGVMRTRCGGGFRVHRRRADY